jgi:hypothetical protein
MEEEEKRIQRRRRREEEEEDDKEGGICQALPGTAATCSAASSALEGVSIPAAP